MKSMSIKDEKSLLYMWDTFDHTNKDTKVSYTQYFQDIIQLIQSDLSEPYCIYTLRYFLYSWPWLCHFVYDISHPSGSIQKTIIGVVIGRIEFKGFAQSSSQDINIDSNGNIPNPKGYIAMLVVKSGHRGLGLGKELVQRFISSIKEANVSKIYLETETCNATSLSLYEKLGFIRTKFLPKYYWNGNDAYRLKLYL